ncbi:phage tail tube protein [Methylolobus aquaticus]
MSRIGNMATFSANGASFSTEGDFTLRLKPVKRSPVMSSDGECHHTEELVPGVVTGTVFMVPGFNPDVLTELTNATILVAMGSETVGVLEGAMFTGDGDTNTKTGVMQVEFSGRGRWLPN